MTPALRFARGFFAEALADFIAERFAVHGFAFEFRARSLHYPAHLFQRVCAGFGDGFFDGASHFVIAGSGGPKLLDVSFFLGLFMRESPPAPLSVVFLRPARGHHATV